MKQWFKRIAQFLCMVLLVAGNAGTCAAVNPSAQIVVNANTNLGTFNRAEQNINLTGRSNSYKNTLVEDVDFLAEHGLGTGKVRVWLNLNDVRNSNGTFHYETYTDYFNAASRNASELLLCIQYPYVIGLDPDDPGQKTTFTYNGQVRTKNWRLADVQESVKQVVTDLKKQYPKLKYIECLNEPDMKAGEGGEGGSYEMSAENYYKVYQCFNAAINAVNSDTSIAGIAKDPILLGGPVTCKLNTSYIPAFLEQYQKDGSAGKRLDFISYHQYHNIDEELSPPSAIRNKPARLNLDITRIRTYLKENNLNVDTPVFVTETGIFPGGLRSGLDEGNSDIYDSLIQAAAAANLSYYYAHTAPNQVVPFTWLPRHNSELIKSQLVSDHAAAGETDNTYVHPTGKFTPFGNATVMLGKLKSTLLQSTETPRTQNGIGLYSIATKDDSGMSILAWNYQWTGSAQYDTTITVNHLPEFYKGRDVTANIYLVDDTHSNFRNTPESPNLELLRQSKMTPDGDSVSIDVTLQRNALVLVELVPSQNIDSIGNNRYPLISGNKPVTASKSAAGFEASKITDGNFTNRWGPNANAAEFPHWVQIDLGKVQEVNSADIYWYNPAGSERSYSYYIEVSKDGKSYRRVVDRTNNKETGTLHDIIGTRARYVRLTVTGCSTGGYAWLHEINLYGAPILLSQGKNVTVSKSGTGFSPSKLTNGNFSDRWGPNTSGLNHWVCVDLGSKQYVNYFDVFWYNDPANLRYYTYTVDISDDNEHFTRVAERGDNTVMDMTRDIINREARYIKVTVTGALGQPYVWIREIQAWGVSG